MYRALVSFSGLVSMACGEVAEISDLSTANDLLRAGYIEEVKTGRKPAKEEVKKEVVAEVKETKPRKNNSKRRTPKGGK